MWSQKQQGSSSSFCSSWGGLVYSLLLMLFCVSVSQPAKTTKLYGGGSDHNVSPVWTASHSGQQWRQGGGMAQHPRPQPDVQLLLPAPHPQWRADNLYPIPSQPTHMWCCCMLFGVHLEPRMGLSARAQRVQHDPSWEPLMSTHWGLMLLEQKPLLWPGTDTNMSTRC